MRRVVITGMGALSPIGNNLNDFWKNLVSGLSGANKISRFDTSNFKTDFACEVKGFNALDYFDRKEARKMDRFNHYGLVCADEAVADAKLDFETMNRDRIGVIWSSGIGGFETFETEVEGYFSGNKIPRYNPFFIPKIIANGVSGYISIKYGLRGVNTCPVTACASSTQGLIHAYNYIKWDKADLIITGGSEAPITESATGGFNSMKALSINNDNFQSASKPFDKDRDGFVMGEGAAALVVESLDSAIARGAKIYAEIIGGGESADAYHITGTHPEGMGAYLAMKEALREAGVEAKELDYLNAHATSTGLGDLSEIKAIGKLVDHSYENLTVSATKSMTGHLLGAAGAIEAIATAMAIQNDCIPPTINTENIDDQIPADLDLCLGKSKSKKVTYAMSNSFGFGGHCAAVLMKKYTP